MEIILVRHGKTTSLPDTTISGRDLGEWSRRYNETGISKDLPPPDRLRQLAAGSSCVLASDLRRSIESAEWLSPVGVRIDPDLREAVLPDSMGVPLRLPPAAWKAIARTAWTMNVAKSSEDIQATRERASRVADRLGALAAEHGRVMVVAHRTFNHLVGMQLLKREWRGPRFISGAYWGSATFTR